MSRTATSSGGGGGFRPEVGMHNVICCQLVDFGTHDKEWQGKIIGKVNKVNFGFEFVDVTLESESGTYHPIWGAQFTNSLGKKTSLRPLLEGWRGKPFTEEEAKGFDLSKLLGLSCVLVIQPNSKCNPKIQAIAKAKAEFKGKRELKEFWVEEGCFDREIPDWMPDWMKEEIQNCYECKVGFDFDSQPEPEPMPSEKEDDFPDIDDEDVPF